MATTTAAEPEYARALAIREKTLGSDHPDVAQALEGMAALYEQTKRRDEAAGTARHGRRLSARSSR